MSAATASLNAFEQVTHLILTGEKKTLASLYPFEISYSRPFKSAVGSGYHTDYIIPAAPFDGPPTMLKVGAGVQWSHVGGGRWADEPDPGGAMSVARDVLRFARNVPDVTGTSGPAIWLCAGDTWTKEEADRNRAGQVRWARLRIAKADNWHINGQRGNITDLERTLAQWMHIDTRAHPWVLLEERADLNPCPACKTKIESDASICPQCHFVVDARALKAIERMRDALAKEEDSLQAEYAAVGEELPTESPVVAPPLDPKHKK